MDFVECGETSEHYKTTHEHSQNGFGNVGHPLLAPLKTKHGESKI